MSDYDFSNQILNDESFYLKYNKLSHLLTEYLFSSLDINEVSDVLKDKDVFKDKIIQLIKEMPIDFFEKVGVDAYGNINTMGMKIAKMGDFDMFKLLIDKGIDLNHFLDVKHYVGNDLTEKITDTNIINYMIDLGLKITTGIAYSNQDINYPRLESGRPVAQLKYHDKNQCNAGYYLPVVRYEDIYYSAESGNEHDFANEILSALGLKEFCGTFYYYEPYSSFYLNMGKTLIAGSKYDAVKQLLSVLGRSFSDLKYLDESAPSEEDIIRDHKVHFQEKWSNVLSISNDQNDDNEFMIYHSEYETRYLGKFYYAVMDGYDQTICMMAKEAGYDTVLLQKEPGKYRTVTEILDVRSRTISYDSICKFEDRPMTNFAKNKKYPLIWLPSDGFLEFNGQTRLDSNDIFSSNDISLLNTYLQSNIPNIDKLNDRIDSNKTPDDVRNFLLTYRYLSEMNLQDYLSQDYYNRGINNLMVISSRGYLPLLKLKAEQIQPLLNSRSVDGKKAIDYSSGEVFEYLSGF